MQKVLLAVTNDIVTDNRIHKIATSLTQNGYAVTLAGRKVHKNYPGSLNDYRILRFQLWFHKGPLFYLNYNLRLFAHLLFNRYDIVVANDLDTLAGAMLGGKLRSMELMFDSHEYFTGVPELKDRPFVRQIWKKLEQWAIPKIKYCYTVSEPIANLYYKEYQSHFELIRNVGYFKYDTDFTNTPRSANTPIILYQGALNKGRGLEMLIEAMRYLDHAVLWIIGSGDVEKELQRLVEYFRLANKVKFLGRVAYNELWQYTTQASLGISAEEDMGINYRFALPNKLFDYIQARVPVLVSDLPEMAKLVRNYQIGEIIAYREPELVAEQMRRMLSDEIMQLEWKRNLELAARDLCWQREEEKLLELFRKVQKNNP